MSRQIHSLHITDLSAFAKGLREQIAALVETPSHVDMLNMLARSAGFRNYQHFKAVSEDAPPVDPVDLTLVEKVSRHFDADGVLMRWPSKNSLQPLCLWALWSRLEPGRDYADRENTELLNAWASFGDHALLRRALVDMGYVTRTADGRTYRRIEQKPPAELSVLLKRVGPKQP
ncbi:DUF2087 domain-containing protein [Devosia sp. XJ19-1]|uniref:DUF2087 domain-containing protein n=1 Tax=Devosia ureilytica TaxID=2952754 RepID=A0A9Q4APA7_9HYPH|nr:DUF2087 domain-containing protein [Devosia ureilytica]MCP8883717.1 DUF2087 domain-containing protein [Devosia ureilytica]MCP8887325.1 DUF2087 domain-containing protein [Devosia ureilytica]